MFHSNKTLVLLRFGTLRLFVALTLIEEKTLVGAQCPTVRQIWHE